MVVIFRIVDKRTTGILENISKLTPELLADAVAKTSKVEEMFATFQTILNENPNATMHRKK